MPSDSARLRPLVDALLGLADRPQEALKKELWARHQALEPTEKIPVCVSYEGMPSQQWDHVFGPDHLTCETPAARTIEFDLKRRVWMAENVPDDHIVWPLITVSAVTREVAGWGVPLEWQAAPDPLGARRIIPPFQDDFDVSRLTTPEMAVDSEATSRGVEEAQELVEGRLSVLTRYPNMGHSPFEVLVRMRGMEQIMMDVIDRPDDVHAAMDFITGAYVAHHRQREESGTVNTLVDPEGRYHLGDFMRVIASRLPDDFHERPPKLADEWAYVSAQSSAGLGPAMYDEFVTEYHIRLAELHPANTVYYHGCECLDAKLDSIARLPYLRRHHVSPWSSVSAAREKFWGKVVLEVHAHPGNVCLVYSPDDMRAEIDRLVEAAEGVPMDLNLSDIHTIDGRPETLRTWAELAQDAVSRTARA